MTKCICLTVKIGSKTSDYCLSTKQDAETLLWAIAVKHWRKELPNRVLPSGAKKTIPAFFAPDSGREYVMGPAEILSEQAVKIHDELREKTEAQIRKSEAATAKKAKTLAV